MGDCISFIQKIIRIGSKNFEMLIRTSKFNPIHLKFSGMVHEHMTMSVDFLMGKCYVHLVILRRDFLFPAVQIKRYR